MIDPLLRDAFRFDFYQALRLLERHFGAVRAEVQPARNPVGRDSAPQNELVRFRALPSLGFQPGTINKLQKPQTGGAGPLEMTVGFMGLTGPGGVLPRHYTSLLLSRIREKDFALRDFLDVFNHRVISFFYRAWEKYRFPFAYERSHRAGKDDDLFTQCVRCLVGLGTAAQRGRLEIDDRPFTYFAGHFAHRIPTAVSLERMLTEQFGLPITVQQFCGQWLYLDNENRSRLPNTSTLGDCYNQLGMSIVVGERIWDVQSKFRLVAGPLDRQQFQRLMPEGKMLRLLVQFTRSYVGQEFDFDVQLVLRPREVPWCRLAAKGPDPPRLGWNTWLRSRDFDKEADDAVFSL